MREKKEHEIADALLFIGHFMGLTGILLISASKIIKTKDHLPDRPVYTPDLAEAIIRESMYFKHQT